MPVGHAEAFSTSRPVETARGAQLDAWLDGIFDAESLVALIGPEAN